MPATTGTHQGHSYRVTYATEDDWPVTSVRVSLRRPLPAGIAIHPSGASPWSSGRIGPRACLLGDAQFDKAFTVRCDRDADVRMLGQPEVRRVLLAAITAHPGLWIGNDAIVCVERGHIRESERLESLLDEVCAIAMILGTGPAAAEPAKPKARERPQRAPSREARPAVQPAPAAARAPAPALAKASSGSTAPVDEFVRACFDRSVAAYEVNRRIAREWTGRRLSGTAQVSLANRLGGHDFDFSDLKGYKVELRLMGPEEIAPLIRIQVQLDESAAGTVAGLQAGQTVGFEGPLASANPLLHTIQIVSGRLG